MNSQHLKLKNQYANKNFGVMSVSNSEGGELSVNNPEPLQALLRCPIIRMINYMPQSRLDRLKDSLTTLLGK